MASDPHPGFAEAVTVTRFWRNVDSSGGECWPWLGDRDRNGYGLFFYQGRMRPAHEMALSFWTGEVKVDGLDTCHSCDSPPCCNPDHLRFDTRQSNVSDMISRGRARYSGKLSPEQVTLIRERRASGARQIDLAKQFGVTDGTISMIVRGIRWPNVPGPIETERKYIHG